MRDSIIKSLLVCGLVGVLAGCGAASSGLSTGSLFGSSKPQPVAAAVPVAVTPAARAKHVAATVARAQRCGFYFDPVALKANYLAAEAQAGTPPQEVDRITKVYNGTFVGITRSMASDPDSCSNVQNSKIKEDLNRQLAGDFTPPKQVASKSDGSLWDALSVSNKRDTFSAQEVIDRTEGTIRSKGEE